VFDPLRWLSYLLRVIPAVAVEPLLEFFIIETREDDGPSYPWGE
jgi:hypothetical protein